MISRRTLLKNGALAIAAAQSGAIHLAGASVPHISGPYQPNWTSLQRWQAPDWFRDAKFGIYYHWGPYSVPAFMNEWYPHWMYIPGTPQYKHHVKTYGPLNKFGYKDFIPMFKAEHWDPDAWVSLFIDAGAKYMGPVAEHADGFSMWKSRVNRWNAYNMGPRRDLVGDMQKAVRKRGMKFVTTFHHHWLWGWYESPEKDADIYRPEYADFYWPTPYVPETGGHALPGAFNFKHPDPAPTRRFSEIWRDKVNEVVDAYDPDLIYFDGRTFIIPELYRQQMLAHFFNRAAERNRKVVMTFKFEDFAKGTGVADFEAGQLSKAVDYPWQTDDLMDWSVSWSYSQTPDYKAPTWLVHQLIDIVSKNGNLLLDVGPRPDGTIPDPMKERLRTIGSWLRMNGEAIYGTRPWSVTFGEGPTRVREGAYVAKHIPDFTAQDIRFTTKGNALYVIVLGWPGASLHVSSVHTGAVLPSGSIRNVSMLGSQARIRWYLDDNGLTLTMPEQHPGEIAWAFKLT